ncbi:MAG: hypothetical protein EOP83_03215, partial [Verrucomicrobiaceae bacterium]
MQAVENHVGQSKRIEAADEAGERVLGKRRAGLLVPVYALRRAHDFGIGDTAAMIEAIDFVTEQGFSVLQVLPIHETFGDHSPY